eukprot:1250_1
MLGVTEYEEPKATRTILNFLSEAQHQHGPCVSSDEMDGVPQSPLSIGEMQKQTSATTSVKESPIKKAMKGIYRPREMHLPKTKGMSGDRNHRRHQTSRTMSCEESQVLWGLIVGNGMVSSKTIKSLHELEEYTIAASPQLKPQPKSDLFDEK